MGAGASTRDAGHADGPAAPPVKAPVLSGAAEKLVRSTLSYADAERYLAREFAKADANNDTSLDLNEFTKLIRSLSLNISEEEMECLRAAIDSDSDGRIVLSEVLAKSPYLLKKMYEKNVEPSPLDWCRMYDEEGTTFFYNKRTGDVEYDEPAGFTTLETVMSKGKDAGTLVVWMLAEYKARHPSSPAPSLSPAELCLFLCGLKLGLMDTQLEEVVKGVYNAHQATLPCEEALGRVPVALQSTMAGLPMGTHDWARLQEPHHGACTYYNKRTGQSQAEAPPGVNASS